MTYTEQERIDIFWSKVDKSGGEDACWNWLAYKGHRGYGQVYNGRKVVAAHRLSWELTYGLILPNLYVCHHCDNPSCVNPKHLFLGTQKDNIQDCIKKGRNFRGVGYNHGRCKLTEYKANMIRILYSLISKETGKKKNYFHIKHWVSYLKLLAHR